MTSSSRILRIDSTTQIDSCIWNDVRLLIESTENLYPGIDLWLRRKVEPGLRDGSRLCYAAVQDDQPKAVVILKKGYPSKLCTLRVVPEAEGQRLGTLLMLAIARELPRPSEYVYFTIPESVWASCAPFYGNFGFEMRGFAKERYRRGDRELFCVAENRQILRTYIGQVCALYRRYRHDENCSAVTPGFGVESLRTPESKLHALISQAQRSLPAAWTGSVLDNLASRPACWRLMASLISVPGEPEPVSCLVGTAPQRDVFSAAVGNRDDMVTPNYDSGE